ncbi:MAG: PQQ-dependent dehydrogenase, methanol/ethanol family [Acidimicrobiia bacterium]|nr:PQQ-dependent dehydrogenase, methanol/ethanol family [Acidimicrobiia bacterium]
MSARCWMLLAAAAVLSAQVRYEDILKGPSADWITYAGDYAGQRHSPLKQITVENAGHVVPKWFHSLEGAKRLECVPLVKDGVMYFTDSNTVVALDARTGRRIWRYKDEQVKRQDVNRGVALLGSRLYFVTSDAHLVALDAKTGGVHWSVSYAETKKGYFATVAPFAVKNLIIVGVSGGDSGMRGFVAAYHAETGKEVWRTYTIPARGEPGSETWGDLTVDWGGAGTWLSGTYDPALNLIYWTTGNPWPDFYGGDRKGDNLYSDSVIALDPDSGKMKWYFQFTPHDVWDWDAQSWPVLIDMEFNGRMRKVLLHANRNGFFYVLDRVTGEFLRATPYLDKLTWASGVDAKGRPILVPGMEPTPNGKVVCPSIRGGTNWMSHSYNPATGLLYFPTVEQCDVFTSSSKHPEPMKNFAGTGVEAIPKDPGKFYLRALDPKTGKRRWEYPMTGDTSMWAGTVSTAGGVVFFGDDDGHLVAVDARDGRHLWHFNTGQRLTASPITYEVGGKQYVAIAAASGVFAFGLFEPAVSVPPLKISDSR